MHGPELHQGPAAGQALIWLVSGTGEGPGLAQALLARGWRLQVSVVTAAAVRAYPPHPALRLQVGALEGKTAIRAQLEQLRPRWLVDGSHPFARLISAQLEAASRHSGQPLLRLERPTLGSSGEAATLLARLENLASLNLQGERLLLAIGSRHLAAALKASNAAAHYARILDNPTSLQLALAAGMAPERLACLRPGLGDRNGLPDSGGLERALCRHWGISAVLCRQSGGATEQLWRRLAGELGLRLLLLQRPQAAGSGLPLEALLEKLGWPEGPPAPSP